MTNRRNWILRGTLSLLLLALGSVVYFARSKIDSPSPASDSESSTKSGRGIDAASHLESDREPPSEREPEPSEVKANSADRLLVDVVSEPDQPVAGAHVLIFDAKALLGSATTSANGTCSFPAATGEGEILAWNDGRAPARQPTSFAAGRTTVRFTSGSAVSGTTRRTDGKREPNVGLLLESNRPLFEIAGLPPSVLEALPERMRSGLRLEIATDEAGRFVFQGLGPSWAGGLFVDRSVWLVESSQGRLDRDGSKWPYESGIDLTAPFDGLVLTVIELPYVAGRVVSSDGKSAIAHAQLQCIPRVETSPYPPAVPGRAGDDGRFRVPMDPLNHLQTPTWATTHELPPILGVSLGVSAPDDTGRVWREFDLHDPRGPWDLGDVRLGSTRALEFVVHDSAGVPIAGAVGRTKGLQPSKPTDEEGRGHAEAVPEDATEWTVGARGFAVTTVALPRDPSVTLLVVLPRSNELDVLVRGPSGSPAGDVRVEFSGEAPLFARGSDPRSNWSPDSVQTVTGSTPFQSSSWSPSAGASTFVPDAQGRIVLTCVASERTFHLKVLGAATRVLHEEDVPALGPEEKRSIEITLTSTGNDFSGRVLDADGNPIVGASVTLAKEMGESRASTDSQGRFRFERLGDGPYVLAISKRGYATLLDPDYELPRGAAPVEFRLDVGHLVRVHVVDASGRPVKDCDVGIRDSKGAFADEQRTDVGMFECPDLPARTLTFFARVGGVDYPKDHSALDPELTISVPVHGSIEIRLPESLAIDPYRTVRLVLDKVEANDSDSAVDLHPTEQSTRRLLFGAVLPGEYRARLEQWDPTGDENEVEGWKACGGARSIAVKAGETLTLDWSR